MCQNLWLRGGCFCRAGVVLSDKAFCRAGRSHAAAARPEERNRMKKEGSSTANRIWTVVGIILCVVLLPILIINCTLLIKGYTGKGKVPTIGGVFPMIVLTDSMSGTFEAGDLIICRTAKAEDVQLGDIICYYDPMGSGTTTVTHRVAAVTTDASGALAWQTKGDANNTEDYRNL